MLIFISLIITSAKITLQIKKYERKMDHVVDVNACFWDPVYLSTVPQCEPLIGARLSPSSPAVAKWPTAAD